MSTQPQFEPIFPSHAIERCGAAVTFSEHLPVKVFQKVLDQVQERFRKGGLEWIAGAPGSAAVGFQFNMGTGQALPLAPGVGPAVFATTDRATQFIIAPNSMTARTTSYVRWAPCAGQIEELMLPLISLYSDVVSVANVQLDYVDRFLWTGDWSNFDWRALLRSDGQFLAARAAEGHRLWHSHSGWFDERDEGRDLVNVNVDLMEFQRPEGTVPSIAILTLMRDDVAGRYDDAASVQACLEKLHYGLKSLLGQIINEPMAKRISLYAEASDVTRH
jgi:uncharacterized protein (TIGR04255 family)